MGFIIEIISGMIALGLFLAGTLFLLTTCIVGLFAIGRWLVSRCR